MSEMLKKLSCFFKNLKNGWGIRIVVILGAAGILLIFFSEIFDKEDQEQLSTGQKLSCSFDSYAEKMEKELRETIENIDGVGRAEVMITVGGTEEYIYAQEEKSKKGEKDQSVENEYVVIGSGGNKQALLRKILTPEITGAAIICEGGDSSVVKERIYMTVSAVFGISSDKIYVTKLK